MHNIRFICYNNKCRAKKEMNATTEEESDERTSPESKFIKSDKTMNGIDRAFRVYIYLIYYSPTYL
jgi:hypothetical protein